MLWDEDHQEWARSAVTSSDRSALQLIGVLHFWTVGVHMYMHGGLRFPWMWWMWRTYWMDRNREQGDQGRLDGFEGPDPNRSRVGIESKDET